MAKAVFTTKRSPTYDDLVEERYHFPRTYLRQVEAAVGDWIVYYEPWRTTGDRASGGGLMAYFATARVVRVVPDASREGLYYAHVADFLEFDRPVPFAEGGVYAESALRKDDGSTNKGAFGRAVRLLADVEYTAIVAAGFSELLTPIAADGAGAVSEDRWSWTEDAPGARPRVPCIGERWFRDRAFTARVREVYENRCAFTGLRIVNGGGRPEVQAAHIRPVAKDGPDSVRNGIALSQTVHWMFDRHLIALEDDGRIRVASRGVPSEFRRLLLPELRAALPSEPAARPHPEFLRYHRELFKG
jgi:putative restriction endonuclease